MSLSSLFLSPGIACLLELRTAKIAGVNTFLHDTCTDISFSFFVQVYSPVLSLFLSVCMMKLNSNDTEVVNCAGGGTKAQSVHHLNFPITHFHALLFLMYDHNLTPTHSHGSLAASAVRPRVTGVMPQNADGVTVPVVQAQHLPRANRDDKTPQVVSHSVSGKFGAKLARHEMTDPCHRLWNIHTHTRTFTQKERWRQRNTHSGTEAFTLSDVRFEPKSPHTHSYTPAVLMLTGLSVLLLVHPSVKH